MVANIAVETDQNAFLDKTPMARSVTCRKNLPGRCFIGRSNSSSVICPIGMALPTPALAENIEAPLLFFDLFERSFKIVNFWRLGARCRCLAADLPDDDVELWLPATRNEDALPGRQTLCADDPTLLPPVTSTISPESLMAIFFS
jgi:hypothetical protein